MAKPEWLKKENARIHKNTMEFIKKEKEKHGREKCEKVKKLD